MASYGKVILVPASWFGQITFARQGLDSV